MSTIFLIFNTYGIGGAEKRLVGLWLYLKDFFPNYKLVCSKELYDKLIKQAEFTTLFNYQNDILLIPFGGSTRQNSLLLKSFIADNVSAGDKLHFVTFFPLLLKKKKGVDYLLTYPGTGLNNVNITGGLYYMASFFRADKIDVLDPGFSKWLKKIYPFKRETIFRTSNSYVDTNKYMPKYPKKNWIVFLGRFIEKKGILKLVNALPIIHQILINKGINDHHFYLLGYGPLEGEVKSRINSKEYLLLPVTVQASHEPERILESSKIFLSLNSENNYPSKSLLEGLSAGNLPIVTDVGTTDMIAPKAFSTYLPKNFTSTQLANTISDTLSLNENDYNKLSTEARNFVMRNFTLKQMADYYIDFYK